MPNTKRISILVTAVAGDIGQAIVKCLRLMPESPQIFGCDINPDIGYAFVDTVFPVPPAVEPGYLDRIVEICNLYEIEAVIPASEAEMGVLSKAVVKKNFPENVSLVCQEHDWMEKFGDKLLCFKELEKIVDLAAFADGSNERAVRQFIHDSGFPAIVKSRRGFGSKNLQFVQNEKDLMAALRRIPEPLVQQFIADDFGEFSVGVFSCGGFIRMIAFKRDLGPAGNSWYADNHDQDEDVLAYCLKIVQTSGLYGSCNIQVRKDSKGVKLLEINPRFSSLVAARAICGFRDLEWSLRLALGQKIETPAASFQKIRFRRYFHELVDYGNGYGAVPEWYPKSQIHRGEN